MDSEPPRDTYAEFLQHTKPFEPYIVPHRGEAAVLADEIPLQLDLLFIDGDHSYEMVKTELEIYAPRVRPGGFLLLHDCQEESVQRAINEYFPADLAANAETVHSLRAFRLPLRSV